MASDVPMQVQILEILCPCKINYGDTPPTDQLPESHAIADHLAYWELDLRVNDPASAANRLCYLESLRAREKGNTTP